MKTCIYLRKSRKDRDHLNESIEETLRRHEEQLLAHAQKAGLNIVEIKKEVVTGDSIALRPQMQDLLEEVEEGLYDAVLVMAIDRLGRGDMIDQGIVANTFKKSGTRILTPDKEYNLDDEYDEEFYDLSAFFARKELKTIKRRLQRGKKKSIQDGNYIGTSAPYGYDKHDKTLVFNEEEKPIVELIFDLYVNQGMGDTKIARYLTERAILNKSGKTIWDRTTIRNMIRNPVYMGKIAWGKRDFSYTDKGKRTSKFKPLSEWQIYDGRHEAIISEEMFSQAQELSKDRYTPHIHIKSPLRNPISYIMKCGACGHTMTIRTSKGKQDTLRCYRHCGGVSSAYISIIEEALIGQLEDLLYDLECNYDYEAQRRNIDQEYELLENAIKAIDAELDQLATQKIKQYELLEQGIYDTDTFLQRSRAVAEATDNAKDRKEEALQQMDKCIEDIDKIGNSLPKIKRARDFLRESYWASDPQHKNEFLLEIIDQVVYFKERGAPKEDLTLDITLKF